MDCPDMVRHGSRIYAENCTGPQQAYLIDRIASIIEIEAEDGTKVKAKVKSVKGDRAILEVVAE